MAFPKLKEQPLCRNCGKPIRKETTSHYRSMHAGKEGWKTLADAQRQFNEKIISHKWSTDEEGKRTAIFVVHTWDGESYSDDLFCSGKCAESFGRAVARQNKLAMPKYHEAMKARRAKS